MEKVVAVVEKLANGMGNGELGRTLYSKKDTVVNSGGENGVSVGSKHFNTTGHKNVSGYPNMDVSTGEDGGAVAETKVTHAAFDYLMLCLYRKIILLIPIAAFHFQF